MARRRQPTHDPGRVPPALTDHRAALWRDPVAFERLCSGTGISPRLHRWPDWETAPWWARFDAYRQAWCHANNQLTTYGTIDREQAAKAGIDTTSMIRYRFGPSTDSLER